MTAPDSKAIRSHATQSKSPAPNAHTSPVTIYHNPNCGTSRTTLGLIRDRGIEPAIIEYLKIPPTRDRLFELLSSMGLRPRDLLRRKEARYAELRLHDPKWTDDELVKLMIQHPILIERPIVATPKGAALCRPPEKVLSLL